MLVLIQIFTPILRPQGKSLFKSTKRCHFHHATTEAINQHPVVLVLPVVWGVNGNQDKTSTVYKKRYVSTA